MSGSSEVQIIKMPNRLRAKIGNRPGPSLDDIVADAEAALDGLEVHYQGWIEDYLAALKGALTDALADPLAAQEPLDRIRRVSHEVKGQGATFGYPLLTTVAYLLHRLVANHPGLAMKHLDVVGAHVHFMTIVVRDRVRDAGGRRENEIVAGLKAATQRIGAG